MKKLLLATAMGLLACPLVVLPACAQRLNANSNAQAGSESASGSYSGVTQNTYEADPAAPGNIGDPGRPYTSDLNYGGAYTVHNTPDVFPPSFSGGTNTCMGPAVSGGVAVAGFGLGAGFSRLDKDCEYRAASAMLWLEGQHNAAVNELCFNVPGVSDAMEAAGAPCPPNPAEQSATRRVVAEQHVSVRHVAHCHYDIREPNNPNGAADAVRVCD